MPLDVLTRDATQAAAEDRPRRQRYKRAVDERPHKWFKGDCLRCGMRPHWPGAKDACAGRDVDPPRRPELDYDEVQALVDAGHSIRAVAGLLGTTPHYVRVTLREGGER